MNMNKLENIKSEMFTAMKAKEKNKIEVLKSVMNHAQSIAKETNTDITDEIVIQAVNKEIKQLNQTFGYIEDSTDCDLYKKIKEQITIIESYLPQMMTKEEIQQEIQEVLESLKITNATNSDKGRIMKLLMARVKGKADGKLISTILDENFNKLH